MLIKQLKLASEENLALLQSLVPQIFKQLRHHQKSSIERSLVFIGALVVDEHIFEIGPRLAQLIERNRGEVSRRTSLVQHREYIYQRVENILVLLCLLKQDFYQVIRNPHT